MAEYTEVSEQAGQTPASSSPSLGPYEMKIIIILHRLQVVGSGRIAEMFGGWREVAEKYLKRLETMGFARIQARKPFGKSHFDKEVEANIWELTDKGRAFIEAEIQKGADTRLKISEMNKKLAAPCNETMKLLEKPLSFDELLKALNESGIKIRKYKLGDVLKILEASGFIIKVFGPGGVMVYMKTEDADAESAVA